MHRTGAVRHFRNKWQWTARQHPFASQWHARIAQQTSTSHCTLTIFILWFCSSSLDAANRPCLLSLDCEMCETATSSRELIGLGVVNEAGSTVLKVIGCLTAASPCTCSLPVSLTHYHLSLQSSQSLLPWHLCAAQEYAFYTAKLSASPFATANADMM